MKSKVIFIIFLVFFTFADSFSQNYPFINRRYVNSNELSFMFQNGFFSYINNEYEQFGEAGLDEIAITIKGSYKIKSISNYIVAEVDFPDGKRDIFVFAKGQHAILYDTKIDRIIYGTDKVFDEPFIYPVHYVSATSYFTEIIQGKEVSYPPDNLTTGDITKPWVEGAEGYGIGEKLRVGRYDSVKGIRHLLILNGFFSPKKPELYLDNSRLKKIMMRGFDKDGNLIYEGVKELADTPNLQIISSVIPCVEFELEILDVYPGRKYTDTAVSGVFHDGILYIEEMNPNQ